MTYEGYRIGPVLRSLRKKKKISVFEASEMTGLSTNTINKIEQGSRRMSMSTLYLFMTAYEADANTLLDLSGGAGGVEEGIDRKLSLLPTQTQDYLRTTFEVMIAQAQKLGA
ncbi:MAG: helix-turn-helix domain-containing protein [Lachnospiraceae bacterium]